MKKILSVLLVLCMLIGVLTGVLTACADPNTDADDPAAGTATDTAADTAAGADTDPAADSATESEDETVTESVTETLPASETDAETEPSTEAESTTDTAPESESESETEPAPAGETDASGYLIAGSDTEIVRDGTPKKYFTIRMDDGITQDEKTMEILQKYGADCCTFYLNSGLLGDNWAWVGQQFNRPDVTHQRYTRKELKNGVYDGFDVGVHTQTHPSLKSLSDAEVTQQVEGDRKALARILGYTAVGMAWPGGDTEWTDHTVETVLATTNIRYGSCTTRTGSFDLPEYFMAWYPTCSFSDADVLTLAEQFIAAEPTEDMLFFVWCHGYELDLFGTWDKFDTLIQMITEAAAEDDSIVLVTNSEFYHLFKDEIPSWKE